ncbi:unnamed protein product [Cylicocyclus nassatus]|uniref:Uncharacterized protein n=1 Tax=Cylicocyclus nassatus TaxID=53992 RepID=A0AA36GWM5_CYLNA|nr:unnamed protein product [Cylicocyclus nassatus]
MNFLLISLLLFSILGVSLEWQSTNVVVHHVVGKKPHCRPHCAKVCKNQRVGKCRKLHTHPPRQQCTFINKPVCHKKCTQRCRR